MEDISEDYTLNKAIDNCESHSEMINKFIFSFKKVNENHFNTNKTLNDYILAKNEKGHLERIGNIHLLQFFPHLKKLKNTNIFSMI